MTENDREPIAEEADEQKSFFARGALVGLVGGALVALLLIGVAGSVFSLFDNVFGSSTAQAEAEPAIVDPVVAAGEAAAGANGCVACHTTNGVASTGPSWKDLSDRVDAEYVRQAIVDPNAVIADGFTAGVMPQDYANSISADDIDALVAYILSL